MSRVSPQCPLDRLLGDLVEDHAPDGHLGLEHLDEVPGDRLALAILVRREQELVGGLELAAEVADDALLPGIDDVEGLEVVLDVDSEPGPARLLVAPPAPRRRL